AVRGGVPEGRDADHRESGFRAEERFVASRPSTRATISSSVSDRSPCCSALRRTRQSPRSTCSAPPKRERAPEEGLARPSAALAYLSKGTRSASSAPSAEQSFPTQS